MVELLHSMFYTEYRPKKFSELIGADHIVSAITGALAKGLPSHAYFFYGSRGIGKTTTARLLAKALNCDAPFISGGSFEPCGECQSCQSVHNGNHLDLIEIDAASNRGIENIRDIKENVVLSPSMGKNKVYIIDEVHMLTTEASNALLKLLEEPPTHAYFILCTTNPEKVIDTIKSRCQQFQFKRPNIDEIKQKLLRISQDKGFELTEEQIQKISKSAKGAFREAETLLEQLINGNSSSVEDLFETNTDYALLGQMIVTSDISSAIEHINKIYLDGNNLEVWTEKYISYLRSVLLLRVGAKGVLSDSFDVNHDFVKKSSLELLQKMVKRFTEALFEFKTTVIPTLPLEMALIDIMIDKIPEEKVTSSSPLEINVVEKPSAKKEEDKPVEVKEVKDVKKAPVATKDFPYKKLIESVKPHNHSIYLILYSCDMASFDGKYLNLVAYYSFHKERVMSMKVKEIIQAEAEKLVGCPVVVKCELSDKKPDAKKLTDKNVKEVKDPMDIEEVFEKVFGDDLEEN